MANYVFLMELGNNTLSDQDEHAFIRLTVTGCGLSFVGTMLSLCLICFLPVATDGMFILCNLSASLLGAQLAFVGAENSYSEKIMCKIATVVLHYLFLCLHFSSLTYGIHLLLKLRPSQLMVRNFKRVSVVLITWGIPLLIVMLTATVRWHTYATSDLCWLSKENGTRWAFLGPVLVIQLVNSVIFFIVMSVRFYIDSRNRCRIFKIVSNQWTTAISIFPVLGLTWSLGFAATFGLSKLFQYIFVTLASTQGLLIFLGHVLTNINIRKALCVTMNPEDNDNSRSYSLSGDYTHSSFVVELDDQESDSKHGEKSDGSTDKSRRRHSDVGKQQKKINHNLRVPGNNCRRRQSYSK